jgi:predicted RND superfamily exporter protein
VASFIPADSSTGTVSEILEGSSLNYIATSERFWRISARLDQNAVATQGDLLETLQKAFGGQSVRVTGPVVMMHQVQREIAISLGRLLALSGGFLLILLIVALRSPVRAVIAMLPPTASIAIVFGAAGYLGNDFGLGMLLAASIAWGVSVSCSLSIVRRYQQQRCVSVDSRHAALAALQSSGPALRASFVAGAGLLPLLLCQFPSTAMCGMTTAASVLIATILDIVMLPVLLSFRPSFALRWLNQSTATEGADTEAAKQPWLTGPHVPLAGMKVGKL